MPKTGAPRFSRSLPTDSRLRVRFETPFAIFVRNPNHKQSEISLRSNGVSPLCSKLKADAEGRHALQSWTQLFQKLDLEEQLLVSGFKAFKNKGSVY